MTTTYTPDVVEDEDEFINDDCPALCNTRHETEPDEMSGMLTCPETGETFVWCTMCCDWRFVSAYGEPQPIRIHGETVCDPFDHGYDTCEGCGEWFDQDDLRFHEGEYASFCETCYEQHSHQGSPGEAVERCAVCDTSNLHMDLYTEQFVCDCDALALVMRGTPVEFATAQYRNPVRAFIDSLRRVFLDAMTATTTTPMEVAA